MYTQNKGAEFNFKCFNQQITWSWCGTAAILFGTVHLEQHLHMCSYMYHSPRTDIREINTIATYLVSTTASKHNLTQCGNRTY